MGDHHVLIEGVGDHPLLCEGYHPVLCDEQGEEGGRKGWKTHGSYSVTAGRGCEG